VPPSIVPVKIELRPTPVTAATVPENRRDVAERLIQSVVAFELAAFDDDAVHAASVGRMRRNFKRVRRLLRAKRALPADPLYTAA
jgi:hypothetical protein